MAMGLESLRETRRMVAMTAAWSAWLPCEKLSRATFMPAAIRAAILSSELVAGPMVQTILVRRKLTSTMHLVPIGLLVIMAKVREIITRPFWKRCNFARISAQINLSQAPGRALR